MSIFFKGKFKDLIKDFPMRLNCSAGAFLISLTVFIIAAILIFFMQGTTAYYEMDFELLFSGISRGEYPNGLLFNANDIISGEILEKVYEKNRLESYIDYRDFVNSIAIIQKNDTPHKLQAEYFGRLKSHDIDPRERIWLEDEYKSKLNTAFDPNYTFIFLRRDNSLPLDTASKIFTDILECWREVSIDERSICLYQFPITTENILKYNDYLDTNDNWFVFLDKTKSMVSYVRDNIRSLGSIPSVRTAYTDEGLGISDMEYMLNALESHKITPLSFLITTEDKAEHFYIDIYLSNIISYLNTNMALLYNIKEIYDTSFSLYLSIYTDEGAMISKAGDDRPGSKNVPSRVGISFLDNIISIARNNVDYEFRQNIINKIINSSLSITEAEKDLEGYLELQKIIKENVNFSKDPSKRLVTREYVTESIEDISSELTYIIGELNNLYRKISITDLVNSEGSLYAVKTEPSTVISRKIGFRRVFLLCMFAWFAVLFIISEASKKKKGR